MISTICWDTVCVSHTNAPPDGNGLAASQQWHLEAGYKTAHVFTSTQCHTLCHTGETHLSVQYESWKARNKRKTGTLTSLKNTSNCSSATRIRSRLISLLAAAIQLVMRHCNMVISGSSEARHNNTDGSLKHGGPNDSDLPSNCIALQGQQLCVGRVRVRRENVKAAAQSHRNSAAKRRNVDVICHGIATIKQTQVRKIPSGINEGDADTFYGDKHNPLWIWYCFADTLMVRCDAPYSRGGHFPPTSRSRWETWMLALCNAAALQVASRINVVNLENCSHFTAFQLIRD